MHRNILIVNLLSVNDWTAATLPHNCSNDAGFIKRSLFSSICHYDAKWLTASKTVICMGSCKPCTFTAREPDLWDYEQRRVWLMNYFSRSGPSFYIVWYALHPVAWLEVWARERQNLAERDPLATVWRPLSNTQKKIKKLLWIRMSWMSILQPKNENTPKNAKNNNVLKTKIILNIKMSVKGGPVFTFGLPGLGGSPPCPHVSYTTDYINPS